MRVGRRAVLATVMVGTGSGPEPLAAQPTETRFPTRPIRLVVTWAPGLTDMLARAVAPKMADDLGRPVVVDNRPGAAGATGTAAVARAVPDGHTLLLANADVFSVNPVIRSRLPYDVIRDFTPVSWLARQALILAVNPQVPATTLTGLFALGRTSPNRFSYASWGIGSVGHLAFEMLLAPSGVAMVHSPYNSTPPALLDVVAGRVDMLFLSMASGREAFAAGQLRPIAITSRARSALMPDLPTIAESGFPDFEMGAWYGIAAPSATPSSVIQRLNQSVRLACASPDVADRFARIGLEIAASSPEEMAGAVRLDTLRWREAARIARVQLD
jgi:tripartite-type tricarboxylate transporter receptor subunit TctC